MANVKIKSIKIKSGNIGHKAIKNLIITILKKIVKYANYLIIMRETILKRSKMSIKENESFK